MGSCSAFLIAAALWIGLVAGRGRSPAWAVGFAGAAVLFVWLARRAPDRVGTVALLLAVVAAGLARGAARSHLLLAASNGLCAEAPASWLSARVIDHPSRESEDVGATLEILRASPRLPRGARIRLRLPPRSAVEWGDTLRVLARIEAASLARVPGVPAPREGAWSQDIVARGRGLWVTAPESRGAIRSTLTRWRRHLEACFARELTPDARAIVTPLVVGDRSALDPDLSAMFRSSGLVHLLALSGLHVVWMAGVARGLAAALGGGIRARAFAGASCALFYMGVAGPIPSLARAAATEGIAAWASLRGKVLDPTQGLALAAIALLTVAPSWSCDLGFQLSCAATLGLTTLGRHATEWLDDRPGRIATVVHGFVPTAAAQVTALPIVLDRFHALPWTMLGSNLLAVPICDLLMATAWLGAGFEALAPGAGRWCLAACEPLSRALVAIARTSASAPSASWATGHSPWPPWLAACGAAFAVLVCLRRRDLEHALLPPSRGRVAMSWAAPLALALSIALGASAPPLLPPRGCWWLVAIDVGQGDALAIGGARGWQLVDAGPRAPTWDAGASAVVPFFQWAAVRRLDAVILTHGHGDHAGGLRAVRRALPVEHWWRTGASAAPRVAASARAAWAGDTLGRDPILAVRWPVAGFESSDLNAGSLVLDVGEGRARAWLAADVDSAVEDQITTSGPCAVLKVAHHGASSSSGVRFLARLRPEWAVISCGTHNPFGHPDPHALLRLASSGARVRRTDRHGTVWLELGNEGVREIDWSRDAFETRIDITPTPTPPGTLARAPSRC